MPAMTSKFKSFADALTAAAEGSVAPAQPAQPKPKPKAANDNRPPRYRGTLPALRWLYDNHPELAPAMARAVKSLANASWRHDASDDDQDIRPTIGEIARAARGEDGEWLAPTIDRSNPEAIRIRLGALKFDGNELIEYGITKKGRKLQPRDRAKPRGASASADRTGNLYVFRTRSTTPSPLQAESQHRSMSGSPALQPMYSPQEGVEANRNILRDFGVDGSVAFADLPFPATKCPNAIAPGAEFLGGIARSSGNTSSGAVEMWEGPSIPKGEVRRVVEEVASGATLKDIGERMGYAGVRVDRTAKDVLVDAARVLAASNDNNKRKRAA